MKTCKKCNLELNEECFPIKQIMPGGKRSYRGTCKVCTHIEKMPYIVTLPHNTKVCTLCNCIKPIDQIVKGTSKCIPCYNESRRKEKIIIEFKTCNDCKIEKNLEEFRDRQGRKDQTYKHSLCKGCENKRRRIRTVLKEKTIIKDSRYNTNLERINFIKKEYKKIARAKRYDMSVDELDVMETEQNNQCYLCNKKAEHNTYGTLCIDHCHKSGKVRKLLCNACNAFLGAAKDDVEFLRKCATYIEDFS